MPALNVCFADPLCFLPVIAAGKTLTEAEFTKMSESLPLTALWNPSTSTKLPSFTEVMGFSGSPEIINGRLAMLAFVAAVGAELSSGAWLALVVPTIAIIRIDINDITPRTLREHYR